MIIDGSTSLLMVSVDYLPPDIKKQVDAISLSTYTPSEAANNATADAFDAFIRSDAHLGRLRIPIPIDDRLLPIVQQGADARMNVQATKLQFDAPDGKSGQKDVYTPTRNTLALSFRMLSKMGTVSTIADILHALEVIGTTVPVYCSWFSKTDCIFNARLVGIGRSSEKNSDMEAVTLSLERAPNKLEPDGKPDAEELVVDKVTEPSPTPGLVEGYTSATRADFKPGWRYYELGVMDALLQQPVPYQETGFTIQRADVETFLVVSADKTGPRNLQGARHLGKLITLEQREGAKYAGPLALLRFANRLIMGVAE